MLRVYIMPCGITQNTDIGKGFPLMIKVIGKLQNLLLKLKRSTDLRECFVNVSIDLIFCNKMNWLSQTNRNEKSTLCVTSSDVKTITTTKIRKKIERPYQRTLQNLIPISNFTNHVKCVFLNKLCYK